MIEPAIELFETEWSSITELCSGLSPDEWAAETECPGWSVQDNLAHLIGTESMLLGRPAPGPPVRAPHVRNDMGAANEAWIASLRPLSGVALLDRWREVAAARLAQLRGFPAQRWDEVGPTPVGQAPYREFMSVRVMDCWSHEQDMRRAVGRPGHRSGPVADAALSRFVSAMPFVVGKKAGASDGVTVVFELTGEAARAITVAVDGVRAKVIDGPPPAIPTVRLVMDAETWWRLCLGRGHGHAVTMEGDRALGEAIVENLGFMI